MKIISKEKDFYDYLVSSFGIDEDRVFVRNNDIYNVLEYRTYASVLHIFIGGLRFDFVYSSERDSNYNLVQMFRTGDSLSMFEVSEKQTRSYKRNKHIDDNNVKVYFIDDTFVCASPNPLSGYEKVNDFYNAPIVCIKSSPYSYENVYLKNDFNILPSNDSKSFAHINLNINLSKLGLKFSDASVIYNRIYNYLGRIVDIKQSTTSIQSNESKILSKGFDTKTSFRPKMK